MVEACLVSFAYQWQRLICDCHTFQILRNGMMLDWNTLLPLTKRLVFFCTRNTTQILQQVVEKLLFKGAIEPVYRPETKLLQPPVPGAKQRRSWICVLLSISPSWTAIPKFPDSRLKPRHPSGLPSDRVNGLYPSTYKAHISKFLWQGSYGNICVLWWTGVFTRSHAFHSVWLDPLWNIPSCCDLWSSFFGSEVSNCMCIWMTHSSKPCSYKGLVHAYLAPHVLQHLSWDINFSKFKLIPSQEFNIIGTQFSTQGDTMATLPKMRLKVHSRTLWIMGDPAHLYLLKTSIDWTSWPH